MFFQEGLITPAQVRTQTLGNQPSVFVRKGKHRNTKHETQSTYTAKRSEYSRNLLVQKADRNQLSRSLRLNGIGLQFALEDFDQVQEEAGEEPAAKDGKEHDIFSEDGQDKPAYDNIDYGCCGDNLPMPDLTHDSESGSLPVDNPICRVVGTFENQKALQQVVAPKAAQLSGTMHIKRRQSSKLAGTEHEGTAPSRSKSRNERIGSPMSITKANPTLLKSIVQNAEETIFMFQTPGMSWFYLFIVLMISICCQWQRFTLAYVKGFTGIGGLYESSHYSVLKEYPQLQEYYGLLSGVLFALPLSVCTIFMGLATDKVSRKWLLGIGCISWSLIGCATGYFNSFMVFAVCRVALGITQATCNPAAYSLIRDMFPPNRRATANSIYSSGIYVGNAISSLCISLIKDFGWRQDFIIPGYVGVVFGVCGLLFLREPERGHFSQITLHQEKPKKKEMKQTGIQTVSE